jgi:GH24 family phage-related lysozyme (muramidase)
MTNAARLAASTDADEGWKSSPYPDSKKLYTVAKGRCLETNPLTGVEWRYLLANKLVSFSITEAGADWLRDRDLQGAEAALRAHYHWFDGLNDARQNAFIEMKYQLGPHFDGFHDMLAAAAVGNWTRVHDEALDSDWARDDSPARARALALQLLTGAFPQA